jgi:hypothetical protein
MAFCNIKKKKKNTTKAKKYLILSLCFGKKKKVQIKSFMPTKAKPILGNAPPYSFSIDFPKNYVEKCNKKPKI